MHGQAMSKHKFARLTIDWTWGSHHLPFYSIICVWPQGQHPNVILFQDSQMGVPKISKLGLLRLWTPITLCVNLWLRWGLKQSCSPCLSHATCTQGNQGDSRLLVVRSQIANLTFGFSFGHNMCFKCPHGTCKPILDIYVPKYFQWYK